jgi:hypothetical protein
MRIAVLLIAAFLSIGSDALAHDGERPEFEGHRFDEDWRALCQPSRLAEPLDRLKCIDLAPTATLTLGGELRERAELVRNPDFGLEKRQDHVFLHRAMLHADLRLRETARAFVQLGAFGYSGREGEREPFDLDRLDLIQGFLDVSVPIRGDRATLRAGRQEISLGSSRLVGVREGPNVRRAFDGVRAFVFGTDYRVDGFYLRPVSISPGVFDDATDDRETFWGVYGTGTVGGPLRADLYYLGLRRDMGRFAADNARERRHSLGLRLFGEAGGFDWDWEAVQQFGEFGNLSVGAWTIATDTGFTFAGAPLAPRLGLRADIASGDHDPSDSRLGTFNALYPKLPYFSEANLVAPANIMDLHPNVQLRPAVALKLDLGWNLIWRESLRDAVYRTPLVSIEGTAGAGGRFIGHQAMVGAEWQLQPELVVAGQYVHFLPSSSLSQGGGRQVDFLFTSVSWKF